MLERFLKDNGINGSELARRLTRRLESMGREDVKPVSPETVRRYLLPRGHRDRRVPQGVYMQALIDETGGAVTPNSFYEVPDREDAA